MKKSIVGICMLLFVCIASISVSCNAEGQNAASDDQKDEVLTIYCGNTAKLDLPETYSEDRYQSVSSDENVAEVKMGMIAAKSEGSAVITTTDQTTDEVYETKVEVKAGKLSLKSDVSDIEVSQLATIYPVLNKGVFTSISYTSSDPSVASVELAGNRGLVRGTGRGSAEITAVADVFGTERTASITITVSGRIIPVDNPKDASEYTKESEWSGDRVYFGHYEQDNDLNTGLEPILWRVLEVTDDSVFLLSEYGLENRNVIDTYQEFTWETSSIRKYLNEDFVRTAFTAKELDCILDSVVETADNKKFGTSGGNTTVDKAFLLSVEEATNPAYGFYPKFTSSSATRTVQVTEFSLEHDGYKKESNGNTCWWLRSMGLNNYYAAYIYTNGSGTYQSFIGRRHDAIRPAIRVDLDSVSFVKAEEAEYYTLLAN